MLALILSDILRKIITYIVLLRSWDTIGRIATTCLYLASICQSLAIIRCKVFVS